MTVWAVHPTGHRTANISEFGTVVYINDRYIYADELNNDGELPISFQRNLVTASHSFRFDRDYVLIDGDHLQLVALSALLGFRLQRFRVLRWDRTVNAYVPATVSAF